MRFYLSCFDSLFSFFEIELNLGQRDGINYNSYKMAGEKEKEKGAPGSRMC